MPRLVVGALLLFGSGACALVYQVAWARELRLVFGHSTGASAAVIAVFAAGLGLGGLKIGPRADRHPHPLALYGLLELAVAVLAALSPLLLAAVRSAWIAAGGEPALGPALAFPLRLLLVALVLGPPTFLMGGTLPAVARAVVGHGDLARRALALLYGINTLGAVVGAFGATFFGLEALGTRRTLFAAAILNVGVAALALLLAPRAPAVAVPEPLPTARGDRLPRATTLALAAVSGFAFFALEMVWYRMLSPLLGGTVFTFGLVLAMALLGIGLGGVVLALRDPSREATASGLATLSLVGACAVLLPFAAGERLALFAQLLGGLDVMGFPGFVLKWSLIAALVVLPGAAFAGAVFPQLLALLGRADEGVGRDIGLAYAWNTAGAVAGALASGFGLIPLFGALGTWRLAALLLVGTGLLCAAHAARSRGPRALGLPALLTVAALALAAAPGPGPVWRHSGIGTGRSLIALDAEPNALREALRDTRRTLVAEWEGREAALGVVGGDGLAFVLNGKNDGNTLVDGSTQVMVGLIGGLRHGAPKRSLVIGLGSGSSAGWMAAIPGTERVDVYEMEPRVLDFARMAGAVNHGALDNPKLKVEFGDARERLLVSRESYDLIVSEPSNPFRAGIASLYTLEYYRAVEARLAPGGVFVQWLQGYEVDGQAVATVYHTLLEVFPHVESWRLAGSDLALVASREPLAFDAARTRALLEREPYRTALRDVWRAHGLEGLLARYLGGPALARRVAEGWELAPNTDDRNALEFGFARALGLAEPLPMDALLAAATEAQADLPDLGEESVDLLAIEEERVRIGSSEDVAPGRLRFPGAELEVRQAVHEHWREWRLFMALEAWRAQPLRITGLHETAVVAELLAEAGDARAEALALEVAAARPAEGDALLARLRARQGRASEAVDHFERAFAGWRDQPWASRAILKRALDLAVETAAGDDAFARRLLAATAERFAARSADDARLGTRQRLLTQLDHPPACVDLLAEMEPHVPWTRDWLGFRARCYAAQSHPRLEIALMELAEELSLDPQIRSLPIRAPE
ncbi:MAG: fused MFS/spermidine synthase [Vicinamibacteria bacterium]|nr:fused MFS/spermidine synthase [Vicinamibacteria bacterium]